MTKSYIKVNVATAFTREEATLALLASALARLEERILDRLSNACVGSSLEMRRLILPQTDASRRTDLS